MIDARLRASTPRYTPLLWRIFATNAAVLAVVSAVTVIAAVRPPAASQEVVILAVGLTVMLLLNLFLMRRAFAPLEQLKDSVRSIESVVPGIRVSVDGGDSEATELAQSFNEMLARIEHEQRESIRRALDAQEAERLRIAQELHDEVGGSLTAVLLQLGTASRRAPDELKAMLGEAQETARSSLENVRRIALQLRPEALEDLGLVSALKVFSDRLTEQTGIDVDESLPGVLPPLTPEEELVIYRIAQEALTNVVRHSGSKQARLRLELDVEELRLYVGDSGRGLAGNGPSSGIRGMQERAALIGASLSVRNGPLGGVEVTLQVPLQMESSESR